MDRSISCGRNFYSMALSGLAVFAIVAFATRPMAATPAPATAKAASGQLVLYTAWDEGDINAVIAGFNKTYPNVKVSAIRSEGGRGAMLR